MLVTGNTHHRHERKGDPAMIDFGGGMIFPSRYGRDQFSPAEERQQLAEEAVRERFATDVQDFETERLLASLDLPPGGKPGRLLLEMHCEAKLRGLSGYRQYRTLEAALLRTNLADLSDLR